LLQMYLYVSRCLDTKTSWNIELKFSLHWLRVGTAVTPVWMSCLAILTIRAARCSRRTVRTSCHEDEFRLLSELPSPPRISSRRRTSLRRTVRPCDDVGLTTWVRRSGPATDCINVLI